MEWEQYLIQGVELLYLGIGTYFDIKTRELPPAFLAVFGVLGVLCNLLWSYQSLRSLLFGGCIGGIFLVIGRLTGEAIGYGDGLCMMVLGIFEGVRGMVPIILASFLLSGGYGLLRMIGFGETGKDTIPFLPFLFLALMGVIFL